MEPAPDLAQVRELAASTPGFVRDHLRALEEAPPERALPLLDALMEGLDGTLRAAVRAAHPGAPPDPVATLPDAMLGDAATLASWARDALLRRLDEFTGHALGHRQALQRLARATGSEGDAARALVDALHARAEARAEETLAALAMWRRECERAAAPAAPPAPLRAPWPALLERARALAGPAPAAARACLALALEEGFRGKLDPEDRAPSFGRLVSAAHAAGVPLPLAPEALAALHQALAAGTGPHAREGDDVVAWRLLDAVGLAVNRMEMTTVPDETRAALVRALAG